MATEAKELRPFTDMGFKLIGTDGSGHFVIEHPVGGRMSVSKTPSDHRTRPNELATARRRIREGKPSVDRFTDYLREKYGVPADGSKVITVAIMDDVREFVDREVAEGRKRYSVNAIQVAIGKTPFIEQVQRAYGCGKGKVKPGKYRIYGSMALPTAVSRTAGWNDYRKKKVNGQGQKPPPVLSDVPPEHADKSAGIEVAPGVFVDPTLPAPGGLNLRGQAPEKEPPAQITPPAAPTKRARTNGNGHANGNGLHPQHVQPPAVDTGWRPGRLGAQLVDAAELNELRGLVHHLTQAVLPEQIERRDLARDALHRAERTLVASREAMGDALGEVRACLALLEQEASLAPA